MRSVLKPKPVGYAVQAFFQIAILYKSLSDELLFKQICPKYVDVNVDGYAAAGDLRLTP